MQPTSTSKNNRPRRNRKNFVIEGPIPFWTGPLSAITLVMLSVMIVITAAWWLGWVRTSFLVIDVGFFAIAIAVMLYLRWRDWTLANDILKVRGAA